jgi:GNAT superfamily N-acetyltransferase
MAAIMIEIRRTTNDHPDFASLVAGLDADLWARYGEVQGQYAPLNILQVDTAVVAYLDRTPAGCGCFKRFDETSVELKRVYVPPALRGRGVARAIVASLEDWARELGIRTMILETGNLQHEAIALYGKLGYERTAPFPPYCDMPASICMRKHLGA